MAVLKDQTSISIIGCGWLGLPLGAFLVKKGYLVKGSTTKKEKIGLLQEQDIQPYLIEANPRLNGMEIENFFYSDIIIINLPPGRKRPDVATFHPQQISAILAAIQESQQKHQKYYLLVPQEYLDQLTKL